MIRPQPSQLSSLCFLLLTLPFLFDISSVVSSMVFLCCFLDTVAAAQGRMKAKDRYVSRPLLFLWLGFELSSMCLSGIVAIQL